MLQPIGKRVLIQIEEGEQKTNFGLIISGVEEFNETKGKILAVGDEEHLKSLKLSVGDMVIIDDLGAEEFRDEDNNKKIKLKILGTEHILAKVIDQVAE